MSDALVDMSLAEAADALRRRQVSSVELTQACLKQAAAIDSRINCFLAVEADDALVSAQRADAMLARGEPVGALHGVPLAHKDMFYRRGKPCTGGSRIRRDFVAAYDSTLGRRLDSHGAVWLGRLNMSEFAANPAGHNVHYGHCRNPWDVARIAGGSSSGSAAAVSARATFGSVGSDTGGSIRVPAAACGVVGLKPTHGLVSRYGAVPRAWSLDAIGPIARSVEDCAILLSAIAGHDPRDPTTADLPVPDYHAALAKFRVMRVGVPASFFFDGVDPSVRACLDRALAELGALGHDVVEVTLPDMERLFMICDAVSKAEVAAVHGPWMRGRPQDYSSFVHSRSEAGFHLPVTTYLAALTLRAPLLSEFSDHVIEKCDVLFAPVLPMQVPMLEQTEAGDPAEVQRVIYSLTRCTKPINYLGLPALSVPCGFTDNGMPTAFQLIGRPFAERTLLRLGHQYQGITDWHRRRPIGSGI